MQVHSLAQEDPLEKGMATPSSILSWRILWTEEPDGLQTVGSQRVQHNCLSTHADRSSDPSVRQESVWLKGDS